MISTGYKIPYILKTTNPFPFDGIDPSEFVYGGGFIQLRGDYTGAAIRIRRGSDNAEMDIGFKDRIVDVEAMEAFGSDCFITTMYDQVGTGVVWTEPVSATQLTVVKAGSAITQGTGVPGAMNEVGFFNLTSNNFNYPKDFTEFSCFSSELGGSLLGRGGSWSVSTKNGWRNNSQNSGGIESQQYVYNPTSGLLASGGLLDTANPANGVHFSLYADDTNGTGLVRNQETEFPLSWTPVRTTATTNKVYFCRLTSLTSGNLTQHYSVMLNTAIDRADIERRLYAVMGI